MKIRKKDPVVKFPTASRDDSKKKYFKKEGLGDPNALPSSVPGPGTYRRANNGKILDLTKRKAPAFSIGSNGGSRCSNSAPPSFIGPGSYPAPTALGSQVQSRRPNSVSFSMDGCNRDQLSKIFSPGCVPPNDRILSPGPSRYDLPSSYGVDKQPLSSTPSPSAFTFGVGEKLPLPLATSTRDGPGPGGSGTFTRSTLGLQSTSTHPNPFLFKFGGDQRKDPSKYIHTNSFFLSE